MRQINFIEKKAPSSKLQAQEKLQIPGSNHPHSALTLHASRAVAFSYLLSSIFHLPLSRHFRFLQYFFDHAPWGAPGKARLRFHDEPMRDDGDCQFLDLFGSDEVKAIKEREGLSGF